MCGTGEATTCGVYLLPTRVGVVCGVYCGFHTEFRPNDGQTPTDRGSERD